MIRSAYDAAGSAWAAGPDAAYGVLADVLVAASPVPVRLARVLDLGTGTGAAARAVARAGADWVVGLDLAPAMLRAGTGWASAVVGDAEALPFASDSFDLVLAACCLGHLPDPLAGLLEARRLAPGLVASAFIAGWSHPAKAQVDAIATRHGFEVPEWYVRLKSEVEPQVDDRGKLELLAWSAGYRRVEVVVRQVEVGVRTPAGLTAWRLGMAHLAPFVAALTAGQLEQLRLECERSLMDAPPLVVPLLVLSASTVV